MSDEHINTIARRVLADLKRRQKERQSGVMAAVGDFLAGQSKSKKQHRANKKERNGLLW